MVKDKFDAFGPLLSDVGAEIAEIVGGDPDGAYLYAEAGDGWVGGGVFKDDGATIQYFDPSPELCDLLIEFWESEDSDKRWVVMEYEVRGTKFDAKMKYPEDVDPKQTEADRRPAALKARYGDKPIVYPPMPKEAFESQS